jgi:hypothetical protein
MTLRPNTELVATAWIGGITGLSPAMVATQLPQDADTWKATGFVTLRVTGGSPSMYTPLRSPVLSIDTWAVGRNSNKPPWGQANALMELIDTGCRANNAQRWLTLPSGYMQARVTTAYFITEPQRFYQDPGNYARYVGNLTLNWVAAV